MTRIAITHTPGDATRIAREASASGEFDGIVALGGDGTNHEVVAGIDRARMTFGSLPLGQSNCLARDLRLGGLDTAHGIFRYLGTSTFAVGYVAQTAVTSRRTLARLGRGAYAVASVVTRPRPLDARLWLDEVEHDASEITSIVVNNTAHLATFRAFANASVDDGRLDLMGLAGGWAHQIAHNASSLSGIGFAGPRPMRQGALVRVELGTPSTIMLDGEIMHDIRAAEIAVLPRALRCVAAP